MKVKELSFGRTVSFGNFSNAKASITVEPEFGETPEKAFARARAFVDVQLAALSGNLNANHHGIACPCGSTNVRQTEEQWWWYCQDCNSDFREDS